MRGNTCLVSRGTTAKLSAWILALKAMAGGVGGTILGKAVRRGKPHLKTCVAGFRADSNTAPVLLHDTLNRIEAKARTFANSLRGEKGFENMRLDFGRNSRAVIGDLDHGAIVLAIGSNSKLALATHGVNRIVDDVRPNLIELAAKRIYQKWNFLVIARDQDSV